MSFHSSCDSPEYNFLSGSQLFMYNPLIPISKSIGFIKPIAVIPDFTQKSTSLSVVMKLCPRSAHPVPAAAASILSTVRSSVQPCDCRPPVASLVRVKSVCFPCPRQNLVATNSRVFPGLLLSQKDMSYGTHPSHWHFQALTFSWLQIIVMTFSQSEQGSADVNLSARQTQ